MCYSRSGLIQKQVLIESDWNLKKISLTVFLAADSCINRIRLEFKVGSSIKRISYTLPVLIESDWNLKSLAFPPVEMNTPY